MAQVCFPGMSCCIEDMESYVRVERFAAATLGELPAVQGYVLHLSIGGV